MADKLAGEITTIDPVQQAKDNYDSKLRSILEPEFDGQYVAIHPESGDYLVERCRGQSLRAMIERHPDGPISIRHIGIADEGLRARMRGEWPISIANNQRDMHGRQPIGGDRARRRPRGA
jgi:hypothetical protein